MGHLGQSDTDADNKDIVLIMTIIRLSIFINGVDNHRNLTPIQNRTVFVGLLVILIR